MKSQVRLPLALGPYPKDITFLQGVWLIANGRYPPFYVDSRTMRYGTAGLTEWPALGRPTVDSDVTDPSSTLDEATFYCIKVIAEDRRFASSTGVYRSSPPTVITYDPMGDPGYPTNEVHHGVSGKAIRWTIPSHPQLGYDINTPEGDFETTHRTIWLSHGASEAEAANGLFKYKDTITGNTEETWDMNSEYTTQETLVDSYYPPPFARFCHAAFNRVWFCGGVTEDRGKVSVTGTTVTGHAEGADQTYFTSGLVGGKIVVADERSYGITAVDEVLQTLTLDESYDGAYEGLEKEFYIETSFGLYYSAVDHPHWYPVTNYIPLPERPTGLLSVHRSLFVFSKYNIYRFSADAPEQGYYVVPGSGGTEAPRSIVEVSGTIYFWDGVQISATDGVAKKAVSSNRYRQLCTLIDNTRPSMILGGFDPRSRTIHWYFPTVDTDRCQYGVEMHVDTGDIFPVWRSEVSALWQENHQLMMATSGLFALDGASSIMAVADDICTDVIPETVSYRGTLDCKGDDGTRPWIKVNLPLRILDTYQNRHVRLPNEFRSVPVTICVSETEDLTFVAMKGSHRSMAELESGLGPSDLDEDGSPVELEEARFDLDDLNLGKTDPSLFYMEDGSREELEEDVRWDSGNWENSSAAFENESFEMENRRSIVLTFPEADFQAFSGAEIAEGVEVWVGIVPAVYGPKWLDFGSPRFKHKVYDLSFMFPPIGEEARFKVDWYLDLGEDPVKTTIVDVGATTTEVKTSFEYRAGNTVGFRLRIYCRSQVNIQHYNLTWATIR